MNFETRPVTGTQWIIYFVLMSQLLLWKMLESSNWNLVPWTIAICCIIFGFKLTESKKQ